MIWSSKTFFLLSSDESHHCFLYFTISLFINTTKIKWVVICANKCARACINNRMQLILSCPDRTYHVVSVYMRVMPTRKHLNINCDKYSENLQVPVTMCSESFPFREWQQEMLMKSPFDLKEVYDLRRQRGLWCGWRWVGKAILVRGKNMRSHFGTIQL